MTRPEEPTEALPTRALPADPGATVDLGRGGDPTAHRTEATVHLGPSGPDATVHLPAADPTVPFGPPQRAVGWSGDADRTVHFGTPEPTTALSPPAVGSPGAAEPTMYFGATPAPTERLGAMSRTFDGRSGRVEALRGI
ncbi:hypothetical protein ABZV78_31820, partial [Micromonospora sp. NPDC004540]